MYRAEPVERRWKKDKKTSLSNAIFYRLFTPMLFRHSVNYVKLSLAVVLNQECLLELPGDLSPAKVHMP